MMFNLFKNLPFKILAFLLAVSFWFFLVLFQNIIYDIADPLEINIANIAANLQVASPMPEVVVRVTAPKDETGFLRTEDFTAEIDLADLEEGSYTVPIKIKTELKNVNIVSYVPREVTVELEEFSTKSFAVRADIVGSPASDYSIGEKVYKPRLVDVKAPKSLMDNIEYIGHVIELTGSESATMKNTYTLTAYDEDGAPIDYGVEIMPETVETELRLWRHVDSKTVPIVLQFASDVDISRINKSIVTPKTLAIRANVEILSEIESIKSEPITASDIETILTGGEFYVTLIVPEDVTLLVGDPKITVEIK